MKKTLLFSFLSICVMVILFGTTVYMSKLNDKKDEEVTASPDFFNVSQSANYEVVKFVEPNKTVYTMSDVFTETFDTNALFISSDGGNDSNVFYTSEPTLSLEKEDDVENDENSNDISPSESFVQKVNFDTTGMSITVKNKETGKTKKYEDSQYYFELDGEDVKCVTSSDIIVLFESQPNTYLTPGEYTADVFVYLDDGDVVSYPMNFQLVED